MTLRPRQTQAIADVRSAYAAGHRAPVLIAATGFGKTHTAAEIIRSATAKGNRVWFLAHLREILNDTSSRLDAAGIPHGHIRAGFKPDPSLPVQVVSVQSAVRRKVDAPPDLIIVDECHLAVAKTYRQVIEAAGNPRLLGLTATPQRLDGRGLRELFDVLVPTCGTAELVAEGLLAPVRVFAPPPPDLSQLGRRCGDFDQAQAGALLSAPSIVGDALAHWQKLCSGRRGVAFCSTVAHAHAVAERWQRAGYRAMAVHGSSDDGDRREAIEGLRARRLDLVACARLWIAGVDVPEIDAVVWLRPTASLTAWLQGIGRGLRIAPGKQDLIVLDHVGNTHRLGFPTDHREWSLDGAKKPTTTEKAPAVRTCPDCYAALPSLTPVCPCCGHVFTAEENRKLREVDGELQELAPKGYRPGDAVRVDPGHRFSLTQSVWYVSSYDPVFNLVQIAESKALADAIAKGRIDERDNSRALHISYVEPLPHHKPRKPSAEARSLEELQEIGRRLGYKPGWARRVWQGRLAKAGT